MPGGDSPPAPKAVEHYEGREEYRVKEYEVHDLPENELRGESRQRGDPVHLGPAPVPAIRNVDEAEMIQQRDHHHRQQDEVAHLVVAVEFGVSRAEAVHDAGEELLREVGVHRVAVLPVQGHGGADAAGPGQRR